MKRMTKEEKDLQKRLEKCKGIVSQKINVEVKRKLIRTCYERGLKQGPIEIELIEHAFNEWSDNPTKKR